MKRIALGALVTLGLASTLACSGESATVPRRSSDGTSPTPDANGGSAQGSSGGGDQGIAAPGSDAGGGPASDGPWPGSSVILLPWGSQKSPPANAAACGTGLADIVAHLPASYGTQYDIPDDCIAWAEAATIGIDSHVTNYANPYAPAQRAGGFYEMNDQMAFVVEPPVTRLSSVAKYVPASLHGQDYQTDLVDSIQDWDDTPTFLLDEWTVQTNGAAVGVELGKGGKITFQRDGVSGAMELTMYALALGAAVEALDPAYFKSNTQFSQFLGWNAERAMGLYASGAALPVFASSSQAAIYTAWKSSADAAPLRNFARRTFGGAYVTKVLGIAAGME